jgi:hypothetical protein
MIDRINHDRPTQANRSIIPTGYKDAPQYRSSEPQTLELLGFQIQPNLQGEFTNLDCLYSPPRIDRVRVEFIEN